MIETKQKISKKELKLFWNEFILKINGNTSETCEILISNLLDKGKYNTFKFGIKYNYININLLKHFIWYLINKGKYDILIKLIEKNIIDINFNYGNGIILNLYYGVLYNYCYNLHYKNNDMMLNYLIDNGCDINIINENGCNDKKKSIWSYIIYYDLFNIFNYLINDKNIKPKFLNKLNLSNYYIYSFIFKDHTIFHEKTNFYNNKCILYLLKNNMMRKKLLHKSLFYDFINNNNDVLDVELLRSHICISEIKKSKRKNLNFRTMLNNLVL